MLAEATSCEAPRRRAYQRKADQARSITPPPTRESLERLIMQAQAEGRSQIPITVARGSAARMPKRTGSIKLLGNAGPRSSSDRNLIIHEDGLTITAWWHVHDLRLWLASSASRALEGGA